MIPEDLKQRLQEHGQEHLLDALARLDAANRETLIRDLGRIDLAELRTLYQRRHEKDALPERRRVAPLPMPKLDSAQEQSFRQRGEQAFRAGEIAFLVVAGGQGTRLGFDD